MPLLSLIPIKDWVYGGLIVALLIGFGVYTKHERNVGAAHEVAALKASSDKLERETAAQTADLKARAAMAEQTHAKEILALSNRAPVEPVRLCLDSNSRPVVPKGSAAHSGNESASAPATVVQRVPSGDPGSREGAAGPDISGMLEALAASADTVSATLREFQSR